jgi:phage gpG-like protein
MSVTFDISEALQQITNFYSNLNYSPFYRAVGLLMENAVASQFESAGAYFQKGRPWMPLASSTLKQRKRLGYDQTSILIRDGGNAGLLGSFTSTNFGDTIVVGTNKFYAPYLHYGTRKMPARPLFPTSEFGLPPDLIEDVKDIFETFLARI